MGKKIDGIDKALVADVLKRLAGAQQLVQRSGDREGYRVGGALLTSVTKMLGILDKRALLFWSSSTQQEADRRAIEDWLARKGTGSVADVLATVKYAFQNYSKAARDIGTEAHSVIEHLMKQQMGQLPASLEPPVVSDNAAFVVSAFRRWAEQNEFTPLASEKIIFSTKNKASGTFDLLVTVPKHQKLAGKFVIADAKSAKAVYEEHILQVNAYIGLFSEMLELEPGKQVAGLIVRLPKEPGEPEQHVVEFDAAAYKATLALGQMVRWRKK